MNLEVAVHHAQDGDIIFTSVPNYLYQCVEKATVSRTSHVGILFNIKGRWMVAESRVPRSCYTPLEDFVARSRQSWFSIKRYRDGLTATQAEALKSCCDEQMNRWYHLGFKYASDRQFCSKFVFDAYQVAVGVQVGELKTFRELLAKNPEAPTLFWRCWYFGFIPWQRVTVTPASQFEDSQLVTVVSG